MYTKKRLLIYTDSPLASTGYGQISKHLLKGFHESGKYDIEMVGINHCYDWYDMSEYPYIIHTSVNGNDEAQEIAKALVDKGEYDILLVMCDTQWAFELAGYSRRVHPDKKIVISTLYDVDSMFRENGRASGMFEGLLTADIAIVPTKRNRDLIVQALPQLKKTLRWIHYGIDQSELYPLGDQAIRDFRENIGINEDFVILNLNRNQFRKDLPRTMMAFKIFNERHADSKLWLHSKREAQGGDLYNQAYEVGLNIKNLILPREDFHEMVGYSRSEINTIYNLSDCVVSTTLGEGWGFSTVEGMAVKRPVIMPRNTSMIEIIGEREQRGYFAACARDVRGDSRLYKSVTGRCNR